MARSDPSCYATASFSHWRTGTSGHAGIVSKTLDHWDANGLSRQIIGFLLLGHLVPHIDSTGRSLLRQIFIVPFLKRLFFRCQPCAVIAFTHPPSHQPFASPTSSWRGIGVRARGRCPGEKGGMDRALLDVIGETMPWTTLQSNVMDIIGETMDGQWSWKLY